MIKLKRFVIVTLTAVGTLMAAILLIGFMIYESKEMPCGTPVKCQSGGIVIYSGHLNNTAGNTVFVLGPKWRVHMYLHLGTINCEKWEWLAPGNTVGTLGNTGNAKKTPPHVHYGIYTPSPSNTTG